MSISQLDGTQITPKTTFTYDSFGNLASTNAGNGTTKQTFDSLNRLATKTDSDNVIVLNKTYNPNGTLKSSQNNAEKAAGVLDTFAYDADGDVVSSIDCFGYTSSAPACHTTVKWYDGDDRLIEVQQPADPSVDNGQVGLTRYVYDLSSRGTTVPFGGNNYSHGSGPAAYGGLFKTEQYFNPSSATATSGLTWNDVVGTLYDGLDRPTNRLRFVAGISGAQNTTLAYDTASNSLGFLGIKTNAVGEAITL